MTGQETFTKLIEQAYVASEKQKAISETRYASELKYWGIAYHMLGDREVGEALFNEALEIFDRQIGGRPCPEVTDTASLWRLSSEDSDLWDAYRFKDETLFVRRYMQTGKSLVQLDRQTIVSMPLEDLDVLTGMNHYFQELEAAERISRGEGIPYPHPNFMTNIRDTRRPIREHRVFKHELPQEIVDEATQLANDYYAKSNVLDTSGSAFDKEQAILFHNDWASVVWKVYVEYMNRLIPEKSHDQSSHS